MKQTTNIIFEYLELFPNAPSKTLANKIYAEQSAYFTSSDVVYNQVRYYRGQRGKINRKSVSNNNSKYMKDLKIMLVIHHKNILKQKFYEMEKP